MSWLLIGLDESMMTHQYLLKCPHCGALAYFHKSISCTMHGGGDPFTHGYWTDLEYDASLTGSIFRGFNRRTLPITRCRVCNRFYQKRNAEEHDSFDVRNSSKQSANPLVEFLSAQEMYEAISERTYTSPKEEAELRQLAWKIANDSARNQLQEKISQVKRTSLTFKNAHITNEQLDLYIVARSLIASWLEDSECQRFFAVIPGSGDDALLSSDFPNFARMINEAVQQRNETRKRLWEHYNSMPHPEVWWSISNLEKLIMHLDDYLLKAEALRQSGCFDESLRLLGKPEDFSSAFGQLRHAARVIYELAQCGYRFLWFSIGEEDFSTHEIVEQSRRINLNNRAPQNRQILKDAASPRDLIFCREAVQFRMDLDKPDFFVGKSHEQILRMMRYPNCPTCQCRFLWNGNRCGECDPTVFENGPPNSFQSDQLQIELLRSRQPGDS